MDAIQLQIGVRVVGNGNLRSAVGLQLAFPVQRIGLNENIPTAGRDFRNLHIPDGIAFGAVNLHELAVHGLPVIQAPLVHFLENTLTLLHITQIGCQVLLPFLF